jgi:hypothetical protein
MTHKDCPCCLFGCVCIPAAAIVPPAVTREKGNPLTLALQSALVPAQVRKSERATS